MSNSPAVKPLRTWLSVVRCYQLCNDAIAARLKPLGLKVPHYEVLARLAAHPAQTQQQLASNAYVVKSHMSKLLDEMTEYGWVVRAGNDQDRRSKTISLTPLGETMARQAAAVQHEVMQAMFRPLSSQQIADMEASATLVAQALIDLPQPPTSAPP